MVEPGATVSTLALDQTEGMPAAVISPLNPSALPTKSKLFLDSKNQVVVQRDPLEGHVFASECSWSYNSHQGS